MHKIAMFNLKGGTGKTLVTVKLGIALKNAGFKIGIHDVDVTGPKLPVSMGIPRPFPLPEVDVAKSKMFPMKFNGMEIFSEAFVLNDDSPFTWRGGDQRVTAFGQVFELEGTGLYSRVGQALKAVSFSPDLDYILYDLPPTTSDTTLSLFEHLTDIYGTILVCQPTAQAVSDMGRAFNMLHLKKVPILGMVGNMTTAICPHCHESYYPFSDEPADLEVFCKKRGIPYLISIPFTPDKVLIEHLFMELADIVMTAKPVEIWKRSLKTNLQENIMKMTIKAAARKAAKED